MERILEEPIFKTVIVDGEPQQVLDFTWKRTYQVDMVPWLNPDTQEEIEVERLTLTRTEKHMADEVGTVYLVEIQEGCISQMQIYPPEPGPQTKPPTLEERIAALEEAQLASMGL